MDKLMQKIQLYMIPYRNVISTSAIRAVDGIYNVPEEKLTKFIELRNELVEYKQNLLEALSTGDTNRILLCIGETMNKIIEISKNGIMNCGEYALLGLCILLNLGESGSDVRLANIHDHSIVVILKDNLIIIVIDIWQIHFNRNIIYIPEKYIDMLNKYSNRYVKSSVSIEDILVDDF